MLFLVCFFNELFFVALYLCSFSSPHNFGDSTFATIFKNPWSAGALEMARANKIQIDVPRAVAWVCLPVMLAKQWLNIMQLIRASKLLAEGDRKLRNAAGLPRKTKVQ